MQRFARRFARLLIRRHISQPAGFVAIGGGQSNTRRARCAPRAIVDLEFELIICIVVLLWRMKGGQTLEAQAPEEPSFCWN